MEPEQFIYTAYQALLIGLGSGILGVALTSAFYLYIDGFFSVDQNLINKKVQIKLCLTRCRDLFILLHSMTVQGNPFRTILDSRVKTINKTLESLD